MVTGVVMAHVQEQYITIYPDMCIFGIPQNMKVAFAQFICLSEHQFISSLSLYTNL